MAWDDWAYLSLCEIFLIAGGCCVLQCVLAVVTLPLLLIHYAIVRPIGWIVRGVKWCHKKVIHRVEPVEDEDAESGGEGAQDDEPAEE